MRQLVSSVAGRWLTFVSIMKQMERLNQEGKVNVVTCMSLMHVICNGLSKHAPCGPQELENKSNPFPVWFAPRCLGHVLVSLCLVYVSCFVNV